MSRAQYVKVRVVGLSYYAHDFKSCTLLMSSIIESSHQAANNASQQCISFPFRKKELANNTPDAKPATMPMYIFDLLSPREEKRRKEKRREEKFVEVWKFLLE